jgi:predicted ATPase
VAPNLLFHPVFDEAELREPRRALHARIAEAIESQFAEIADTQPELLARHYMEARTYLKILGSCRCAINEE